MGFFTVLFQRIVKVVTFRIDMRKLGETVRLRLDQCSTPTPACRLG